MEIKRNQPDLQARKEQIINEVIGKLRRHFGRTLEEATPSQLYKAVAMTVRDAIMEKWTATRKARVQQQKKRLYYLSVEFLIGRSLVNNIINLCQDEAYRQALEELGVDLAEIEQSEPEPSLGNGGLGRLAACFMDSLATLGLPAMGCGIRYEYGLFRQKIVDGSQVEMPDNWLDDGNVWEVPNLDDQMEVHFGGQIEEDWSSGQLHIRHTGYHTVIAVPYDIPISGYDSDVALSLRLWSARAPQQLDMSLFSRGEYARAAEEAELAQTISKVLYPEDNHQEGKMLRLQQHYFFTSATIQYIVKDFKKRYPHMPLTRLHEKVAIHINDTHPALAIPELMRILLDQEGLSWEDAWQVTRNCFAYTNHTVMSEALERWPLQMFRELLPRIHMITNAINEQYCHDLWEIYPNDFGKISYMSIIAYDQVRMANLALAMSHKVNGVSQLHADILRKDLFADWARTEPDKIIGITNGVTIRRWCVKANPGLTDLITEAIGPDWIKDADQLQKLIPLATDAAFCERFRRIKVENKARLSNYIASKLDIKVDPSSLFDCQAKRLHEYKRQLLNALHILYLYRRIKEDPAADIQKRTFFFAAKASPGYYRAKEIIRLIHAIKDLVESDPVVREKLQVVFLPNYCVSLAEVLIPAAELSEQISTAGKEASGTSNMKFMLNGALTIGTLDGANVEMAQLMGGENIFIFGRKAQEVENMLRNKLYHAGELYETNRALKNVLDMLVDGSLPADHPRQFSDLYQSLLFGDGGNIADPYLVLDDFAPYAEAQEEVQRVYRDTQEWTRRAVLNTAHAGFFSSDRTIREYNERIWHLEPIQMERE
ncbi:MULTISPECIES: glycogen/starch/alpha-glucan phosphorylase [unclassified Clostridium]|jgi:starch phosphorylase|uniref:glycogen/starch/alpha-glucan phosphorylase n=1 Tax=Clostridia TaxID=186801 RepID=UPI0011071F0F|nr:MULTISPECIES: glycogen/starch/alpha-glucan phosphorylase [unclassified Clostridium]